MEHLLSAEALISLATLIVMEVVLGIDNVIFISIFTSRLPEHQQKKARFIGLGLALVARVGLLFAIKWIMSLKANLFAIAGDVADPENHWAFSGRDLILFAGGIFLLYKSVVEIHEKVEGAGEHHVRKALSFGSAIVQIILLDIVFSIDSILTAVGLVDEIAIMIIAVIVAVVVMILFAGAIARFIEKHPTIKMLALSFLLMIGMLLVLESFAVEVPKGYVYFSMAFSFGVELLNMRLRRKAHTPAVAAADAVGPREEEEELKS